MVQSLSRGIQILEYLVDNKLAGCTEIAAILGVNKSSAFRLLQTLMQHDLVQQDELTGKYMLGVGALRISEGLLKNTDIIETAKPLMQQLVKDLEESAHLCMFSNGRALIIFDSKSDAKINVSAKVGASEPMHCSSVGKCLLAFLDEETRNTVMKKLDFATYTPYTISNEADLYKDLDKIRQNGYAVDNEELNLGIRCIAAPIYNYKGEIRYCLAISNTTERLPKEQIDFHGKAVMRCADEISAKLGYTSI